jgi:protein-L-isoaspartate(D-aspartate) O-methyltransferase
MTTFETARRLMVDTQLRPHGVVDRRVIDAFLTVDRRLYLPEKLHNFANSDAELADGGQGFLLSPMTLARFLQVANVNNDDRILLIGSENGYATALLGQFCENFKLVETHGLKHQNGVEHSGLPDFARYNLILVFGRIDHVPDDIQRQMAELGRLIAVTGRETHAKLCRWTKFGQELEKQWLFEAKAAPMSGFEVTAADFVFTI